MFLLQMLMNVYETLAFMMGCAETPMDPTYVIVQSSTQAKTVN